MRISPERWARLEPHFDAALDLGMDAREAYLADLQAEDASLAADLRALLRDRRADWENLPGRLGDLLAAAGSAPPGEPELVDRRIGAWRLVRLLGRGGMSVVYLAERADGKFEQRAAVKVMHWTGGPRTIERFRLEQRSLARLDHPSITRIYDSGITEDGLPYFVMEWVDGVALTRGAGERGLGLRERIRLFVRLCEAVHAAHQSLIVHRDLKPDNVLLTRDGHLKVLDFGIAKWLTEGDDAMNTRQGEGLLTPQYASPEQFLDEPITTATDVYGLGLLLYELLAGRPPYELAGKSVTEQRRLVTEQAPAPLPAAAGDAARRNELRGDLETICARALQKEPARRYDSAAALGEDLRRYLDGKPVQAAPDSLGYRASRFVRRHRAEVSIAALALVGLLAAAATTAWQARVASRERDHARIEATRAERVVDFLVGSLEQTNPYAEGAGAVTMREFLETSANRIDSELAEQPEVRARVYSTMSRVFAHVGEPRRGEQFARRAIQLADSVFGPTSVESAVARIQMARAVAQSSIDSALIHERAAIAALERHGDHESRLLLAGALEDHATHLETRAGADTALAVHRRALAIREALLTPPHSDLARSHHHLASLLSAMGDPAAGAEFERAAGLWKATLGERHPNYASTLNNWAVWLEGRGLPDSARVIYEESLEITRRALGPGARGLATPLNNIGRLALTRGDLAAAQAYLGEAAGLLRETQGSELPLAATLSNLGLAAFLQGDYATAEARYREGRALFERRFGAGHPYVAIADSYVGRALWMQGRTAEAERQLQQALRVLEGQQPAMAPRLVAARTWSGRLWMDREPEKAEARLRDAVERARRDLPEHSPERGEAEVALGLCLRGRGLEEEAAPLLEAGYRSLLAAHGEEHPMTQWARTSRAEDAAAL